MKYGFQSKEAEIFPPMIIVDITNICNLKCIHCAHRIIKKENTYKPNFMKFEVFKRIVDEVKNYKITLIRLASDGESLLHNELIKFIRYAKDNGIKPINLTTNGILMTENMSEQFIETGLDMIDVSIDAANSETYGKIRVGGDFDTVVRNTNKLIELKNKKKSPIKIFVSFVKQEGNSAEVEVFKNYWENKVDKVLIRNFCNVVGILEDDRNDDLPTRWPCPQFWKRVTITNTGNIRFCVEDWRNLTIIGNVINNSIHEIWTGDKYKRLRDIHLKSNYDELPFCKECIDWAASPWDYGYEKLAE